MPGLQYLLYVVTISNVGSSKSQVVEVLTCELEPLVKP